MAMIDDDGHDDDDIILIYISLDIFTTHTVKGYFRQRS